MVIDLGMSRNFTKPVGHARTTGNAVHEIAGPVQNTFQDAFRAAHFPQHIDMDTAFTAGLFMIGRNGLPRLYHSIFNTPGFERASRDKFFLCIEARDPKVDRTKTRALLESLGPTRVSEVER